MHRSMLSYSTVSSSRCRTSVAWREIERVRRHVLSHIQLDPFVRQEPDVGRVRVDAYAVHVGDDRALRRPHLGWAQRLLPDGEKIAKGERASDRGLDVQDAVFSVGMNPVE